MSARGWSWVAIIGGLAVFWLAVGVALVYLSGRGVTW